VLTRTTCCVKTCPELPNLVFIISFQSHLRVFFCTYCEKPFKEQKSLRFHEKTHERRVDERKDFECSHCGKKFVSKQACQNHIGQAHEKIVSFFCKVETCKKGFYTHKALCEHRRIHEERKHACSVCNFMARTKSALSAHMDTHKKDATFKCAICDAAFVSNRRLRTHMSEYIIHFYDFLISLAT
jgi:uncharacterized Zn-finger protein